MLSLTIYHPLNQIQHRKVEKTYQLAQDKKQNENKNQHSQKDQDQKKNYKLNLLV